jgi:hypothetical protein
MVDLDAFLAKHPTKYHRLPKGFREDRRTGHVACPHRDLSVCKLCETNDAIFEVMGQHFFAPLGREVHAEYIRLAIAEDAESGETRGGA